MQNTDPLGIGAITMVWDQYGNFVQLLLGLLFAWLVLNWLSTVAARVDGLSMTVTDLRKDLDELKDEVKAVPHSRP